MALKNEIFKNVHGYDPDKPFLTCTNGKSYNIAEEADDEFDINDQTEADMRNEVEDWYESQRG